MVKSKNIIFEMSIEDITEANVKEKIVPYVNELMQSLINNSCRDVDIKTTIKIISARNARIQIDIRE